jgi:hypothetical protein
LETKKVTKKITTKKKDAENRVFSNQGVLFNPLKTKKLCYYKVGSFYEVDLYELSGNSGKSTIKRRYYQKVNGDLLTMRKPAFIEFLIKNKYIKK